MSYEKFKKNKSGRNAQQYRTFSINEDIMNKLNELTSRGYNVSAIVREAITKAYTDIKANEASDGK